MRSLFAALLGVGLCACDARILGGGAPSGDPSMASPSNPSTPSSPVTPVDPTAPYHPPTMPPGDPSQPPTPPVDECAGVNAVAASTTALRRLSNEQYTSAAKDLTANTALSIALQPQSTGAITETEVSKFQLAAETIVAAGKHYTYLPSGCVVGGNGANDQSCARRFIDALARMAFRHALDADEKTWLYGVYDAARAITGVTPAVTFKDALDVTAQVIFQAPQMLYVVEKGIADATLPAGILRLSGQERATRLALFFWNTTPDAVALDAAEKGALDDAAGVQAEITRLLASPRSHAAIKRFTSWWLQLDPTVRHPSLDAATKNATLFPYDSPALRAAMRTETESLMESVFFGAGSSFKELFTTTTASVNGPLASLYGVAGVPTAQTTFSPVTLDSTRRAGLFTRAAFLTHEASDERQSPIRRGVLLYRDVLCQDLPPPPPNVDDKVPTNTSTTAVLSNRQLMEAKTAGASCQSCHARINNLGFTAENLGAMGQWQTEDVYTVSGTQVKVPIDSAVNQPPAADISGPFKNAVELSAALAASNAAHDCLVQKWFTRAFERPATLVDMCAIRPLREAFKQNHDMKGMLTSLASSGPGLFIQQPAP